MSEGTQNILAFYRGLGSDAAGRMIEEIWRWDWDKLERVHDYIQWLFPTAKASAYNKNAPLVDAECAAAFSADAQLQERLLKSLRLMLDFYGLELQGEEEPSVVEAQHYAERRSNWQDAPAGQLNHNLLRLTRIIESLRLFGLPKYGVALCECLEDIQETESVKIPAKTAAFWRQAAGLA